MNNKYTYKISRVPAEPRSKRLADTGREGTSSADGSVFVSGRGDAAPRYWERVIATADGAELPEEQYYLTPQGAANVCVPGDVTAYSDNPGKEPAQLPVSTDYTTTGLFRAKRGGGLIYDVSTGSWMVDSQMMGGLSNLDITHKGNGNGVSWLQWDSEKKELIAHKSNYAYIDHVHLEYATSSWVSNNFAAASHTHPQYATKTYVDDTFSVIGHTHSQYVTLDTAQTITGKKTFSAGLITGDVTNVYIEFSGGNSLSGKDKNAAISNLYFNYTSASKNTKVDKDNNFMTAGDVAAYGTGGTLANFVPVADAYTYGLVKIDNNTIKKDANGRLYCTVQGGSGGGTTTASYWRPSVNASGVLSWSLDSSTTAPSSVNIKGPKGDQGLPGANGQGVTYQWSGTSLRLGTIDSEGYTSWGSYVNLKGEPGSGGSGGSVNQLPATVFINQGAIFRNSSKNIGIKMSGGNGLSGWAENTSGNIGHLYLNSGAPSSAKVYITNYSAVSSSDIRLKNRMDNVGGVLNALSDIEVFYYTMKDDETQEVQIGVSAQEVMKHFPSVVHEIVPEIADPYFAVDYQTLTTIFAIQGLKELYGRHKSLEHKVSELEDIIKGMQQTIEQLKGGTNGTTN